MKTSKIKRFGTMTKLSVTKHSPKILMGMGGIGMGATLYLVYKAAPEIESIIEEGKAAKELDLPIIKREIAGDLVKALAPPVAMGLATVGCFVWSYNIQAGRISALSGAFTALSGELADVKERYSVKYGEEEADKFFGPTEGCEITTTNDKGKEVTVIEDLPKKHENYISGVWFDKSTEYVTDDHTYNLEWVNMKISQLELKMFQKGYLLLNEVLEELGMDRTRAGALLGWSVNAGFRVETMNLWNEDKEFREPQLYIHWDTPKYVYEDIDFDKSYYY